MKACWTGFLGKNHSWAIIAQNISRQLIHMGHSVDLFPTDGIKRLPSDLLPYVKNYVEDNIHPSSMKISNDYDMSLSYTALKNFPSYLSHSKKNRFGIWCCDAFGKNCLPTGFAKQYKYCDQLLPPSTFAKQVFMDSGIPSSHMTIIPHGIDDVYFDQTRNKIDLGIKNKIIIGSIFGQIHKRKNIEDVFEVYGKAFSNKDDVCLVLKVEDRPPKQSFELDFKTLLDKFKLKYPNHAEVKIISDFLPDMDLLYRSFDIYFNIPHLESFGMTFLEALGSGNVVISSGWGGQVDFLNEENSLVVSGKVSPAPPDALYWEQKYGTFWFKPNVDDAIDKLKYAVSNLEMLKTQFKPNIDGIIHNYSWNKITKDILKMAK
jgi:glycosyltransferase involved in cell wall biosynthesis